jgi:hypothetical protein
MMHGQKNIKIGNVRRKKTLLSPSRNPYCSLNAATSSFVIVELHIGLSLSTI